MSAEQPTTYAKGIHDAKPDPTSNVLDLVNAANRRQDDLRKEHKHFVAMQISHAHQVIKLNAKHARQMSVKESDRLDKIRQVDVINASARSSEALTAIQTLANTTTANADNIKNAVAETAQTIAASTANTVTEINKRLAALEKASYEGVGKQTVADPQMANLIKVVGELAAQKSQDTGKNSGMEKMAGWIIAGVVTIVTLFISAAAVAVTVISKGQ